MSSIASSFESCLRAFEQLILSLDANSSSHNLQDQVSLSELQDEVGRFKIWAGNIAAHRTGKSSLDYRLRDATPLREKIISFLHDMEEIVQEVIPIATGAREPLEVTSNHDDDSIDSYVSEDEASEDSEAPTELQQAFMDVVDIIDCLYKLSITIRNPAPHDRLVKAATVDVAFFESWDIQHVRNKFPLAEDFLAVRLGRAITRRRQYLKYREKHRKKLGQDIALSLQASTKLHEPLPPATYSDVTASIQNKMNIESKAQAHPRSSSAPSVQATTVLTQTTASEFVEISHNLDAESDSGQTQTSYAASVGDGGKLAIPLLPKEYHEGKPFECPYCFSILSIKNTHAWKNHIFRDLQPYVCTFEACNQSSTVFNTRHEWFSHELYFHRKEWSCNAGCGGSFSLQSKFEEHMRQVHSNDFSEHQLPALVEMCHYPIDAEAESSCSLCKEKVLSLDQLRRHLARHLEALSLFALPRNIEENDILFGSDRVQASEVSRESLSNSLNFIDEMESHDSENDINLCEPVIIEELVRSYIKPGTGELPRKFIPTFQKQLKFVLEEKRHENNKERIAAAQILRVISKEMEGERFQSLQSRQDIRDLIVMFYLRATELHQTYMDEDNQPVKMRRNVVDLAAAIFVSILYYAFVEASSYAHDFELQEYLSALENNLARRANGSQQDNSRLDAGELHSLDMAPMQITPKATTNLSGALPIPLSDDTSLQVENHLSFYNLYNSEQEYQATLQELRDTHNTALSGNRWRDIESIKNFSARIDDVEKATKNLLDSLIPMNRLPDAVHGWFSEAKISYMAYARDLPLVNVMLRNSMNKRRDSEVKIVREWLALLQRPVARVGEYFTLFKDVFRNFSEESSHYSKIRRIMESMETFEYDFIVMFDVGEEEQKWLDVDGLEGRFTGLEVSKFDLHSKDRQLLHRGVLERQGQIRDWTSVYVVLLDNCLILTKPVLPKEIGLEEHGKFYEGDTSAIPISEVVLYEGDYLKSEISSLEEYSPVKLRFPLSIKDLGSSRSYLLFTASWEARNAWFEKIKIAKSLHAQSLADQGSEPFRINVLADTAFYRVPLESLKRSIKTLGSPLDLALKSVGEEQFYHPHEQAPLPAQWEELTCATSFSFLGVQMSAVGTARGISICQASTPRNWSGILAIPHVTQIYVIEEDGIFVTLAANTLVIFHLDSMCAYLIYEGKQPQAPKGFRIKGGNNVKKFVYSRVYGRSLIYCAIREGLNTNFIKVFESFFVAPPEKASSGSKMPSHANEPLDLVREVDKFHYIPARVHGLSLTGDHLVVLSTMGIRVMSTKEKIPITVPDPTGPKELVQYLKNQRPLGMFSSPNPQTCICCYERCAALVDMTKDGELLKAPFEFFGKANTAAIDGNYLLLFHDDFVEVRDSGTGAVLQIIEGENIRCLDDAQGGSGKRNVLVVMAHPDLHDRQLVFELVLSPDHQLTNRIGRD